ncbi:metal-dependent hydrolase [Tersicoccus sp. MR15.9]|uniref:metal-dependent hydrolase n=1 Tax=Tersicoccus mangrovi TaxID=3121635 RepID=UPI002FE5223B
MMGAHHAACGAAAWLAVTTHLHVDLTAVHQHYPAAPTGFDIGLGLLDVGPSGVIIGALVCAGAALAPDADHHNATIAHALPPLSNIACTGIGRVAGGHRHGTHAIVGVIAFTVLAWLAGLWTIHTDAFGTVYPAAGALSVLLIAFAVKALQIIPDTVRKIPWVIGLAAGTLIALAAPEQRTWFVTAVTLGVLVHIAGDMLTTGGVNLVWPFTIKPPKVLSGIPVLKECWKENGYLAFPVLGNAGSWREWLMLVPISAYAIFGIGTVLVALSRTGIDHLIATVGLR